ncbi:hypothetical protein [Nocardia sp. NPDC050710]|uniref:hypothetical protein n=1 Tax=Nocardia sp. NPDC050710 TaxID=3157220 RepID=UPI0033F0D1FF
MARNRYPTDDELRESFESELTSVVSGGGMRSGTGLDLDTESALVDIARAYPNISDALVAAARIAFAGQLDGTNAAAGDAHLQRMIDEVNSRRGTS